MSRWEKQRIACPHCGAVQEAKVFVSVNGARIKDAADRIIEGRWSEMSCLKCGRRYRHDAPLLFADIPGGLWIVQYDGSERGRFAVIEEEADAIFEREFMERPPAAIREQARTVQRRVCFGRRQLVEKLLLRRHGFDDRTVECLKLVLMREYARDFFAVGPAEFYLRQVEPGGLHMVAVPIGEPHPVFELRVERPTLDEITRDSERFRAAFPDLFAKLYVSAARYVTESEGDKVAQTVG